MKTLTKTIAIGSSLAAASLTFGGELNEPQDSYSNHGRQLLQKLSNGSISAIIESNYIEWKGSNDSKGNQHITPITLSYSIDGFNFGLRRAYIDSENRTPGRQGHVSTWSDTSISASYTFNNSAWPIKLSLDYNLPNGKSSLSGTEKNAIMDGHLVQQTRFGEGENIGVGIGVTHALSESLIFGAGLSHVKRGLFSPNSDIPGTSLNPGNEVIATTQLQYNATRWMAIGGLIYTTSEATERGKIDYYRKGKRVDLNLTGIYALTENQRLKMDLRYSTQDPDKYINSQGDLEKESANSNGDSVFAALDWGYLFHGGEHTIHLSIDALKVDANSYDQINDLYNAGREKYSLGVGYDYKISKDSSVSIRAHRYKLKDNATPATGGDVNYYGSGIFATLVKSF